MTSWFFSSYLSEGKKESETERKKNLKKNNEGKSIRFQR